MLRNQLIPPPAVRIPSRLIAPIKPPPETDLASTLAKKTVVLLPPN
jgi:hypothetical protein